MKEIKKSIEIDQHTLPDLLIHHPEGESKISSKENFYENAKLFILFGRVIGIIPCSRATYSSYKQLKLRFNKIPAILTFLMASYCLMELGLGTTTVFKRWSMMIKRRGFMGIVVLTHFLLDLFTRFFLYTYFLLNADKLFKIFVMWERINNSNGLFEDKSQRFLSLSMFLFMTPTVTHFVIAFTDMFHRIDGQVVGESLINKNFLEEAYNMILDNWTKFFPFNEFVVVVQLIIFCLTRISQMFATSVIVMFAWATCRQFKILIERTTGAPLSRVFEVDLSHKDKHFWQDLMTRYEGLLLLVKSANNFLSPLIFTFVAVRMYSICRKVFEVLSSSQSNYVSTIVYALGFVVELYNLFLTLFAVAEVNSGAMKILEVLKKYEGNIGLESEVQRLEIQVSSGPHIGFTGLSFYDITKPFLMRVFSTVCTVVITMLQSAASPRKFANA